MCRELEKLLMEERMQGRAEGRAEVVVPVIRILINECAYTLEQAMCCVKIPEDEKSFYRDFFKQEAYEET